MSDLKPHRHILATRMDTDEESGEPVLVITTDLNLNRDNPTFNATALDGLQKHVSAWQQANVHRATIEGPV
ncbi:hypothetical protein [Bradyrhizobium sp. LTSP885]|uniref:hypothetical protein n=1 Tax=Bradyrhizobium sp. LTSP885 TaxID=1619232 RepID=UPI000A6D837C|nr:hypothetical protein [Bradyrhizobium sp. LTSP885]